MTGFGVTPAELQAGGAMLARLSEEIRAELTAVGTQVDGLLSGGWSGGAAQGFAQAWEEWRAGAAHVQGALARMSQLLGATGGNYNLSDRQAEGGMSTVAVNLS